MIDCMILGDSIAVGIAQVRAECKAKAHVGWNSNQWNTKYLHNVADIKAKTVIISLGANDHAGIDTLAELRRLRSAVDSTKVFWIDMGQNRKPLAQAAIETVSREFGDTVLSRPPQHVSQDRVHPTVQGYKLLAKATQ